MVNTKTTVSKKVLAIVLAVACMVAFTPAIAFTSSAHAAAFKVSPTKATVYVGKYKTLKSTKTAKWTSSKKSVAKLTKSKGKTVKVKGVKAGTATISVKYKSTTKKIKITVKKATKVTGVTITNLTTSGTAVKAGDILEATATPTAATVSYQWYVGDTAVTGATKGTFKAATDGIVGKTITCKVTGTGTYTGTVTSAATEAVTAVALTGKPVLSTAAVGEAVTATLAPTNAVVSYQWYLEGVAIDKATSATYTPVAADLGKALTLKVTGINGFTGTYTSDATTVKTPIKSAATLTMPTTAPVVGTAFAPTLKQTADITKNFTDATYQWYLDSYTVGGTNKVATGTSNSLSITPNAADVGHKLVLVVTGGTNYAGTIVSAATGTITQAIGTVTVNGTTTVGQKLTASLGTTGATATYQWFRGTTAISGATAATYTLTSADCGYQIICKATGTGNYTGTVESAATTVVAAAALTVAVTDTDGNAPGAGDTLKATTTPAVAADDVTYQWYKGGTAISGATSATYATASTDAGSTFKCIVTVKDSVSAAYTGSPATSADVTLPAKFTSVTLSKTSDVRVGNTLTATTDPADVATAVTVANKAKGATYTWYADNTATVLQRYTLTTTDELLNGCSTAADKYTVTKDAIGHKIFCVVTTGATGTYSGQSKTSAKTTSVIGVIGSVKVDGNATFTPAVGTKYTVTAFDTAEVAHNSGTDTTAYDNWTIQWYRDNKAISGATSASYTTTAADYKCTLSFTVTGAGKYAATEVSLAGTAAVAEGNLSAVTAYTDAAGATTASVADGNKIMLKDVPTDATVTYQWYRSDESSVADAYTNIASATKIDATTATYAVTTDDIGKTVFCVITPSGAYGTTAVAKGIAGANIVK